MAIATDPGHQASLLSRVISRIEGIERKLWPQESLTTQLDRHYQSVRSLEKELQEADGSSEETLRARQYTTNSKSLIRSSSQSLSNNDIVSFWTLLGASKEWEFRAWGKLGEIGQQHLQMHAWQILLASQDVSSDEVRTAIDSLLLRDDSAAMTVKDLVAETDVNAALYMLYREYIRDYLRSKRANSLRNQFMTYLGIALFSVFGLIYLFSVYGLLTAEASSDAIAAIITTPPFLAGAVLFGVLGASVSGLLTLSDILGEGQIPEYVGAAWLTVGRVVLGAAAALTLMVFLLSGIPDIVLRVGELTPSLMLAVAFVSGFTDRLLLRAVNTVAGDETK